MNLGPEAQALVIFTAFLLVSYLLAVVHSGVELDEFYSPIFVAVPASVLWMLVHKIRLPYGHSLTSELILMVVVQAVAPIALTLLFYYFFPNRWVYTKNLFLASVSCIFVTLFVGFATLAWPLTLLAGFSYLIAVLYSIVVKPEFRQGRRRR